MTETILFPLGHVITMDDEQIKNPLDRVVRRRSGRRDVRCGEYYRDCVRAQN